MMEEERLGRKLKRYLERDDARKVRVLLKDHPGLADMTLNGRQQTALHLAAKHGSADCLSVVLSRVGESAVRARDKHGRCALHLAAKKCVKRFSKSLRMELVEPLVTKSDLDANDKSGITCRYDVQSKDQFNDLASQGSLADAEREGGGMRREAV